VEDGNFGDFEEEVVSEDLEVTIENDDAGREANDVDFGG
jgi:hypothetical protein